MQRESKSGAKEKWLRSDLKRDPTTQRKGAPDKEATKGKGEKTAEGERMVRKPRKEKHNG